MPYMEEAFVGSRPSYKIYITISTAVLFWHVTSNHNIFQKLAPFIFAQFNVQLQAYVAATLTVGICSSWYFEDIFVSWVQTSAHINLCCLTLRIFGGPTEELPDMKQHYVNGISHRRSCRNGEELHEHTWCQVLGNARLTAPKLFLQKLCSSHHNNNLHLVILETYCAYRLPPKDYFSNKS